MRTLSTTLALITVATLTTLAASTGTMAQTQAAGPITSAEAAMRYHLSLEYKEPGSPPWAEIAVTSADHRLNCIVATHTRESLDRGGWVIPWVGAASYAAEHPLVAVRPGEGVTSLGAVVPPQAPFKVAAQRQP